jgi:hypothetical protein
VVFVAMGQHDGRQPLGVLTEIREVGKDQIDPVMMRVRKHQAAINEHHRAVGIVRRALLDDHAVPANLAEATEEHDTDGHLRVEGDRHRLGVAHFWDPSRVASRFW